MTVGPSLQEIIRRRQQAGFVGRDGQLAQFRENLDLSVEDGRRRFIFNIHGDAGVGKTFLVRRLRQIIREHGGLAAYIDENVHGVPDVLAWIEREFAEQGKPLRGLEKRYSTYKLRRQELETDPEAPKEASAFLTHTAVKIGLHAARSVPGAGAVVDMVDADTVAENANRLRAYLGKKFRNHDDARLVLSPTEELTPAFVEDLGEIFEPTTPIVLFFDTYERTASFLDLWLLDLFGGRFGDLPANLVVVASGQLSLDPNRWSQYLSVIADIPLAPFTEVEARQLLSRKGVTNERVANVILELSSRLPLLVAMLAENRPEDPETIGDPSGDAVERFLKWEDDPDRRSVALSAALPRRLNQDIVATLTGAAGAAALFEWLRRLPFVTYNSGICQYHEVVRAAMIRLQRKQSPEVWRQQHRKLAEYHRHAREELKLTDEEGWADPTWHGHILEQMYHLLCAEGIRVLSNVLEHAVLACEVSAALERRWAEMLRHAGCDAQDAAILEWGKRLSSSDTPTAQLVFCTELINRANLSSEMMGVALAVRGIRYYLADKEELALADFNRSVTLNPDAPKPVAYRGETYRWLGRYDEALADFNRAIELKPTYDWAITQRGEAYRLMERYDEALVDFNRAIELKPTYDWAIASRGQVYRALKRYDEALADFNRAIELDSGLDWAIKERCAIYRALRRYDEALADLDYIIELNSDDTWAIVERGITRMELKRYDEALADFNRAIELKPTYDWAIASRGQVYRALKRYDEALADFNRAIELDSGLDWAIAERGEIYRLMDRYDEALVDFNRAIELKPDEREYIAERDETLRQMSLGSL